MSIAGNSETSPAPGRPAHRLRHTHLRLALQALGTILEAKRPADAILQSLFTQHRAAGAKDRANVSALVYGVLRDLRRLDALTSGTREPRLLCGAFLLRQGAHDAAALAALGLGDLQELAARVAVHDDAALSPAQRCNAPDRAFAEWRARWGEEQAVALALALNKQARIDLRVNTLRATRADAIARLAAEGIAAQAAALSPLALTLHQRVALQNTAALREGWIEPQDEGSQLLALLVGARPGERIADFCAGAGGKTLALGAAMQDRGELLALDSSAARLARLGPRQQRAGLTIARSQALRDEHDPGLAGLREHFDAVLVDAPCSASGSWRRNPELRLREPDFAALRRAQSSILDAAATLVRPGGRLVYATCSLFAAENEDVVAKFLARSPAFSRTDAGDALREAGVAYTGATLELFPHRHGTDGFFAVRLQRALAG